MARWSLALVCLVVGGVAGTFVAGPLLHGDNPAPQAVAIPKEITSYRDVVKKVLPAVVSIEARAKPKARVQQERNPRRRADLDDMQLPDEFRKFLEEYQDGQAERPDSAPSGGFGSGFLVDPKGIVLTNFHVVGGSDSVEIQLKDGRKFVSKDIKGDRKTDLAVVRFDAKTPLPYLELGDSDAMEIGDRVLAVGAPFGLTGSVTSGIVSAKGRNGLQMNLYEDFLQTDAAINPGNSGGPLVNLAGQVVGINAAIKSRSGGFQGVGLAIASNLANNVVQQLLKDGTVHRGYLGVQIKDLDDAEVASRLGVKEHTGVVVGQVFDGSPAAKAGLKDGDVVTSIGGKPVTNGRDLQRVVAALPLRQPVDLAVVRDGKAQVLSVTIEEQPDDFGNARVPVQRAPARDKDSVKLDKLGAEVTDLTPELAEELGFRESAKGALITKVDPDGPAARAGLRRGMLVVKADKEPVKSAAAFKAQADRVPVKGVLLQVQSPREGTKYVLVKPGEPVTNN